MIPGTAYGFLSPLHILEILMIPLSLFWLIRWTRNSYGLKLKTQPDVDIPLSKGRVDELKRLWNL